jgi:hypothetical protein
MSSKSFSAVAPSRWVLPIVKPTTKASSLASNPRPRIALESAKCLSDLGGCGKTSVSGGDRFSRAPNPFHVADATA